MLTLRENEKVSNDNQMVKIMVSGANNSDYSNGLLICQQEKANKCNESAKI